MAAEKAGGIDQEVKADGAVEVGCFQTLLHQIGRNSFVIFALPFFLLLKSSLD